MIPQSITDDLPGPIIAAEDIGTRLHHGRNFAYDRSAMYFLRPIEEALINHQTFTDDSQLAI